MIKCTVVEHPSESFSFFLTLDLRGRMYDPLFESGNTEVSHREIPIRASTRIDPKPLLVPENRAFNSSDSFFGSVTKCQAAMPVCFHTGAVKCTEIPFDAADIIYTLSLPMLVRLLLQNSFKLVEHLVPSLVSTSVMLVYCHALVQEGHDGCAPLCFEGNRYE